MHVDENVATDYRQDIYNYYTVLIIEGISL